MWRIAQVVSTTQIIDGGGDDLHRRVEAAYRRRTQVMQAGGGGTDDHQLVAKLIFGTLWFTAGEVRIEIGKGDARPLNSGINNSKVEIILTEGHKREVKQLFKAVGHPVRELRRIEFAGLNVDGVKKGRWRYINRAEIEKLKKLVELDS